MQGELFAFIFIIWVMWPDTLIDGTELLGTLEGRKGEKINTWCRRDEGAAEERVKEC